jgi:hypothetical protein
MRDLAVDKTRDLVLKNGDLQLVKGKALTMQKVQLTLSTNKGEWFLNEEQGIDFRVVLTKNPNIEEILNTIQDGLHQVDETLEITEYNVKTENRHLTLTFKAENDSGEELEFDVSEIQKAGTRILVCSITADNVMSAGNVAESLCVCTSDSKIIDCNV